MGFSFFCGRGGFVIRHRSSRPQRFGGEKVPLQKTRTAVPDTVYATATGPAMFALRQKEMEDLSLEHWARW
jgi:hypothetical protein